MSRVLSFNVTNEVKSINEATFPWKTTQVVLIFFICWLFIQFFLFLRCPIFNFLAVPETLKHFKFKLKINFPIKFIWFLQKRSSRLRWKCFMIWHGFSVDIIQWKICWSFGRDLSLIVPLEPDKLSFRDNHHKSYNFK